MYRIEIKKTDCTNLDFQSLVRLLDEDLVIRDGDDHDFYHPFYGIDTLRHCLLLLKNEKAVGGGVIKFYDYSAADVKKNVRSGVRTRTRFLLSTFKKIRNLGKVSRFPKLKLSNRR